MSKRPQIFLFGGKLGAWESGNTRRLIPSITTSQGSGIANPSIDNDYRRQENKLWKKNESLTNARKYLPFSMQSNNMSPEKEISLPLSGSWWKLQTCYIDTGNNTCLLGPAYSLRATLCASKVPMFMSHYCGVGWRGYCEPCQWCCHLLANWPGWELWRLQRDMEPC